MTGATAVPPDSSGAYSALSNYAAALELRVDELESETDARSLPSIINVPTKTASAATQTAASAELAEMKVLTTKLVAANAQQQKQLASALARLDGGGSDSGSGGGNGGSGGNGSRGCLCSAPHEKHVCVNCKRLVWHADNNCMELEKNAHLCYEGWKSCLV